TQLVVVYSQWYPGKENQFSTTTDPTVYASKPVPAKSAIQCVLKCQRKLRASYFVENTNQCFCVLSENDKLVLSSIGNLNGMFYGINPHQKCIAKTCEEVKSICPECESDFYNLEIMSKETKKFCDFDFKTPLDKCVSVCAKGCPTDLDLKKGCNMKLSCSHGCKMRELGLGVSDCKQRCESDANPSCIVGVNGYTFTLCYQCNRMICNPKESPTIDECKTGCSNY
uniref:Uncharacterized protein n=2 Tax=Clytia hemisphaerica TaxID=252671 RepID=A0A7M5X5Z3_9CNID